MGHSDSSEKADVALGLHLVEAGQDSPHIGCQCHQHFNPFIKQCQAQSKYCDSTVTVMINDTSIHKNQDKIHNHTFICFSNQIMSNINSNSTDSDTLSLTLRIYNFQYLYFCQCQCYKNTVIINVNNVVVIHLLFLSDVDTAGKG